MPDEKTQTTVTLYDEDGKAVGRVPYTANLDRWDGHNWTCGSTGRHLGIGKTKRGLYYLVRGTQWQGEQDRADIVDEDEAREAVMRVNRADLYRELFGEDIPTGDTIKARSRSLYLTDDLWRQLEAKAKGESRSISAMISAILSEAVGAKR